MSLHEHISNRKSALSFSGQVLADGVFIKLFEAARWAPSAFNEQPWRFIAARRDEPSFNIMLDCLAPGNQAWAAKAAFLVATLAKKTSSHNGAPNRHASHDLGLAIGNLTFQALEFGIHLHQMGGFDAQKTISLFSVPEDFEAVTIIAGGYPGDIESLDEPIRARALKPRTRKELNELVFSGTFGESHPLFTHPSPTK